MASRELKVQIDIIGRPEYARLVEFLAAVDRHADAACDVDLQALVRETLDDLLAMRRED
jgi:hypothetical protein